MDNVNVELFGMDPKVQKALSVARNVSVSKAPVLIVGETGVGKKSLAAFIHQYSNRAGQAFEVVDCSLEVEYVENEILGFRDDESGRFVRGALERGNGGTVVLSNIDGLDESFQKRLHKVLNELEDYDIDVRLIATTTKNLSKLVGSGRFYRGLYTILSNNTITLAPLRERIEDLQLVFDHYLTQFTGRKIQIDASAMDKILGHYWTYNIEEVRNVVESTANYLEGDVLTEEELAIGEKKSLNIAIDDEADGIRLMSLKEAERLLIKKALMHTSENRTQAAKILGVSIRTLRNKINEYRIGGSSYFVNLR